MSGKGSFVGMTSREIERHYREVRKSPEYAEEQRKLEERKKLSKGDKVAALADGVDRFAARLDAFEARADAEVEKLYGKWALKINGKWVRYEDGTTATFDSKPKALAAEGRVRPFVPKTSYDEDRRGEPTLR